MATESAEVFNRSTPYRPTSLKNLLLESARLHGDKTAVVALHQGSRSATGTSTNGNYDTYLRWTYSELLDGAKLLAAALQRHGVQRGDRIASLLHNSADWALCFWAAAFLGCPWIAIQPRTATNSSELTHILELSKPKVILAWNAEQFEQLHESAGTSIDAIDVKILATPGNNLLTGWETLESLMAFPAAEFEIVLDEPTAIQDELALVLFTSGTTGQPKGCRHTHRTVTSMFRNHAHSLGLDETCSSVSHLTLAHCFGMLYSVSFWSAGAKVVYPNCAFDPTSTLDALRQEVCTHMPAVPSLLHALLDAASQTRTPAYALRHIEFSGAMISADVIGQAKKQLGSSVVSAHYGMTESGPAASWPYNEIPYTVDGNFVSPGLPVPGGKLRICAPDSRIPLSRGEAGEIHQSSPHVISGYLGGASSDQFYEDESGSWLLTGDQGIMLSSGEVRVSGRYKDIIIRGGENLAPAQIEAVLGCHDHIKVQVVGAPDDILGEVPVAVVHGADSEADHEIVASMQAEVLKQLGPTYAVDEVVMLSDLDLEAFPQTTSGKVKKVELAAAVRRHREHARSRCDSHRDSIGSDKYDAITTDNSMVTLIFSIWARVLGINGDELHANTSIAAMADSLTMMQARRQFQKQGLRVTLPQLLEHPTIASLADFFSRPASPRNSEAPAFPRRDGPPSAVDMIEACGDDSIAQELQYCATPVLSKYGLNWENDVEDVLPMYDILANMAAVRRRLRSAMRRDAFLVRGTSSSQMTGILRRALGEHSAMRSMWFPTSASSVSQVVVRPSERSLNVFVDPNVHTVDLPEDLATVWAGDNTRDCCDSQRGPGALFRATVFDIRDEPDAAGFVYWCNHAAFDATSLSYFRETIDDLLSGRTLSPRTDYKLWADAYYTGCTGPYAQAGAKEFGRRLKGVAAWSEHSIVPAAKAPGFMEGDDAGWIDLATGQPGDPAKRQPLDGENGMTIGNKGLVKVYDLPGLKTLQQQHDLAAHTVLKASLALANVSWTGSNTSFFRSLQSGRQWPFMDPKLAAHLPSAMDVAGPTFQASCDVVHFLPDGYETVGELLQKMKADQEVANRYEHTPLSLALAQLSEADRAAMMERGLSQLFNYLPNNHDLGASKLEQVQSEMNADTGLQWDFTSLGAGRVELFVRWDGCQLRKAEVEAMLDDFGDVADFVSQPENREKLLSDRKTQTRYHVDHAQPGQATAELETVEAAPFITVVDEMEPSPENDSGSVVSPFKVLNNVRSWAASKFRWSDLAGIRGHER